MDYETYRTHSDIQIEISACRKYLTFSKKAAIGVKEKFYYCFKRQKKWEYFLRVELKDVEALMIGPESITFQKLLDWSSEHSANSSVYQYISLHLADCTTIDLIIPSY